PQEYAAADDEEVADGDVLAEADEGDADLLNADGEGDASHERPAYPDAVADSLDASAPEAAADFPPPAQFAAPVAHVADSLANVALPDEYAGDAPLPEEEPLPPPDEFDPEAAAAFDRESAAEFDRELRRESQGGIPAVDEQQDFEPVATDYVAGAPGDYVEPAAHEYVKRAAGEYIEPAGDYVEPAPAAIGYADRPSVSDFAARLDLGDDDPPEEPIAPPPVAYQRQRRASSAGDFPDPPSSSYTFAEQFPDEALPQSTLDRVLAEAGEGEDFDEPHAYGTAPPQPQAYRQAPPEPMHYEPPTVQPRGFDPAPEPPKRPSSDDLEDALQALDVDLGDAGVPRERVRRPTPSSQRPLPGLPIQRPTGPVPLAPKPAATTTGPVRTVAHTVKRAGTKPPTMPPPPPAAAFRKTPTQQVPVTPAPQQQPVRATTDDGIEIDFDEDE
ncbi:MAG TPA: hypothetical protein VMZ53_00320, partial [Kofleriaceae bacterium]|nr:hypothetical protein [Kofleriaceae bacterium]